MGRSALSLERYGQGQSVRTKEDREKALYYASSIAAFLIDLKDMDKKEVNNEK